MAARAKHHTNTAELPVLQWYTNLAVWACCKPIFLSGLWKEMVTMQTWIGISGMPNRSSIGLGKSTLAAELAAEIHYEYGIVPSVVPFAGTLKCLVHRLLSLPREDWYAYSYNLYRAWGYGTTKAWAAAGATVAALYQHSPKAGEKPRKLLQYLGTEVGRNMLEMDVWVRRARVCADGARFVISDDVRFDNEAQAVDIHIGIDAGLNLAGYAANVGGFAPDELFAAHDSERGLTVQPHFVIAPRWTDEQFAVLRAQVLDRIADNVKVAA